MTASENSPPGATALTIAGFDPSGGAGVLADARAFSAFGFRAVAAVTSITFQNSTSVLGATHLSGAAVGAQVFPQLEASVIACAKTGMLPTRDVVSEVSRLFRETILPAPVVDPVIISTSGYRLMDEDALRALIAELLPLARLFTPNIPEAETISGFEIDSEEAMQEAAAAIRSLGARAVLIKGGHLKPGRHESSAQKAKTSGSQHLSEEAIDVLDNDGKLTVFRQRRVPGAQLHGTGCLLSAAIAAGLGKEMTLEDSVLVARRYVLEAIRNSVA